MQNKLVEGTPPELLTGPNITYNDSRLHQRPLGFFIIVLSTMHYFELWCD